MKKGGEYFIKLFIEYEGKMIRILITREEKSSLWNDFIMRNRIETESINW